MKKIFVCIVTLFLLISIFALPSIIAQNNKDDGNGDSSGSKDGDNGSDSDSSDSKGDDKDSDSDNSKDDSESKEDDSKDDSKDNDSDKKDSEKSDSESSNSINSDSKDNDEDETKETIIDELGREVEVITKIKDGETEVRRTYIDENGNKVVIKTKTEIDKDGESETKITKTYISLDGSIVKETTKEEIDENGNVEIKLKIETTFLNGDVIIQEEKTKIEDGETKIVNSIIFKGAEFTTKLKVTAKIEEDGEEKFSVKLSTGAEQPIASPNQVTLAALEILGTTNGFTIEVIEKVREDGTTTAVFKAKANTAGNLFGLPFFKVNIPLETLLDSNGILIDFKEPWYAPFVTGIDKAEICRTEITEGLTKETTITVIITDIKALLEEGNNNVGLCVAECGDTILTDDELCDSNNQLCTTSKGYSGIEECNVECNGYNSCITTEICGDEIINGNEICDDGNTIDGDGCNSLCQIEETLKPIPTTPENTTTN